MAIGGDIPARGNTFRVSHPMYPGHCVTPHITPYTTKVIMRVLSRVSQAETLEEFIGSSRAKREDPPTNTSIRTAD